MTSADEFVLQLLTDKGLLEESTIETARAKVNESEYDGSEDTAALEALVADHSINQQQIADVLAEEFNMETVNLADVRVSTEALEIMPFELANRYKVIPLEVDDSEAELAIFDPLDMDALDSISHVIKRS
ncbi:MAG: type II/IV secretion system protein, partial [Verrucomicrobiota bacterium]|nr:type II/IV secretion system protein [Verrucomicrobiota bacterium]MEC7236333.1 type II/IV secretion system protein [Verrucomicrobiota bacterium]